MGTPEEGGPYGGMQLYKFSHSLQRICFLAESPNEAGFLKAFNVIIQRFNDTIHESRINHAKSMSSSAAADTRSPSAARGCELVAHMRTEAGLARIAAARRCLLS